MWSPNGLLLSVLVSIWRVPVVDVATACPFFMNESIVKGGYSMAAEQLSVISSALNVDCLFALKSNASPKQ